MDFFMKVLGFVFLILSSKTQGDTRNSPNFLGADNN